MNKSKEFDAIRKGLNELSEMVIKRDEGLDELLHELLHIIEEALPKMANIDAVIKDFIQMAESNWAIGKALINAKNTDEYQALKALVEDDKSRCNGC